MGTLSQSLFIPLIGRSSSLRGNRLIVIQSVEKISIALTQAVRSLDRFSSGIK